MTGRSRSRAPPRAAAPGAPATRAPDRGMVAQPRPDDDHRGMTEPPALIEFPRREQAQRRARWAAWAALAVAVAAITTLPPVEVAGLGLVALAVLLGCRPSPVGHGIAALLALGFTLLLAAGTAGLAPIPL